MLGVNEYWTSPWRTPPRPASAPASAQVTTATRSTFTPETDARVGSSETARSDRPSAVRASTIPRSAIPTTASTIATPCAPASRTSQNA
jgi:hypothetical protein